jgi:hypothetical protein
MFMKMVKFLTTACILGLFALRGAHAVSPLISHEEALSLNSEDGAGLIPSGISQELGPKIELTSPATSGEALKSPIKLELLFMPRAASIDFTSLKVLYGRARFDITSRVLGRARFNEDRLTLEEAHLPDGTHFFSVIISDSAGRLTRREFMLLIN